MPERNDSTSWADALLAQAHACREFAEPLRRRSVFLLVKETLRDDRRGSHPGPHPDTAALIAAAYDDPVEYWQMMAYYSPERAGISVEHFLAVHAATRLIDIREHERILAGAGAQAILSDTARPMRERLRVLMADSDYGRLVCADLRAVLADDPLEPRPQAGSPKSRNATTADLDTCIAAMAARSPDGKTDRPTLRKDGMTWMKGRNLRTTAAALVSRFMEDGHEARRRSRSIHKRKR